jgi:ribose-phosphate pyrophosphokinase
MIKLKPYRTVSYGSYENSIPFNSFVFSGGEIQVQAGAPNCPTCRMPKSVEITADLFSAKDFMELFHAVDALRRQGVKELHLVCKYLPYARQDRVMNPGEALGVKVAADMINSLNFESVEIWDAHSDTSLALINNVYHITQTDLARWIPAGVNNRVIVAPDAGAIKKAATTAKLLSKHLVIAEKKRNVQTGEITETKVHSEHIGERDFLILDDICDGGRTFTELAKALKPLTDGKIFLYVTHGIFSKGLDPFREDFEHIYVANPFPGVDLSDPIISQLVIPKTGH